ncbi:nuclear transport factor 2 family protein [Mycolicibacter heraklionensis]|uniref:Nuclear transport factor 2 family protein n=1 Tax=Mycolicibacter heraklionensis TaxID=512402 RepID=A0A9X7ZH28_9MYCO|nr:nuclear transport factor 2 family protein [Mycolicibacter heraklionensis]QZA08122.1 nuclear transport factor 2 family protein [Mycolicibacter heraklionensis]
MSTSEIATVLAWHDALAAGDLDTLEQLSSDDIEVADADGAGQGHQALRRWAASVAVSGGLGRMYVHDGVVVAELAPAEPGAAAQAVAFRVVHDRVTAVFRHDDLDDALAATDLTEADRVD